MKIVAVDDDGEIVDRDALTGAIVDTIEAMPHARRLYPDTYGDDLSAAIRARLTGDDVKIEFSETEYRRALAAIDGVTDPVLALRLGMEAAGIALPVIEEEIPGADVVEAEIVDDDPDPAVYPLADVDRTAELQAVDTTDDPRSITRTAGIDGADGWCPECDTVYPAAQLQTDDLTGNRLCPVCGARVSGMVEVAEGRYAATGSREAGSPGACGAPIGGAHCALPANHLGKHDPTGGAA